jgi:hypothetical protein
LIITKYCNTSVGYGAITNDWSRVGPDNLSRFCHDIVYLVSIARIFMEMTRYSRIPFIKSVNCILNASICFLACDCSSEVNCRLAISDVRFLIAAHVEDDWVPFSIHESGYCIAERMVSFKTRIIYIEILGGS